VRIAVSVLLFGVGLIHLLPVVGVTGAKSLDKLYGTQISDTNLLVLMRHRAVLFGLIGALLIAAAFVPDIQLAAIAVGFVSLLSFIIIAQSTRNYNAKIEQVVRIDIVALIPLAIALGLKLLA
jgi:hypothetical protein